MGLQALSGSNDFVFGLAKIYPNSLTALSGKLDQLDFFSRTLLGSVSEMIETPQTESTGLIEVYVTYVTWKMRIVSRYQKVGSA